MKHQRIMLIGCGGSGKSTLARQLGQATGLPVIHLDQLGWNAGWQPVPREEFDQKLADVLSRDRWIIDGNYGRTIPERLARCDAVIYLDLPRLVCLTSVFKRIISNHNHSRIDMADGCPERFDWNFVKWVWSFNRDHREKFLKMLSEANDKAVFMIRSRREIPGLIEQLRG